MNELKVLRNGVTIPSKFIKDIERLADGVRCKLDKGLSFLGLSFSSDIVYRASAAWKDEPIHYCYIGDFSVVTIDWCCASDPFSPMCHQVRGWFSSLVAYARVVFELGGQLTFDEHGKHTVFFRGCHF